MRKPDSVVRIPTPLNQNFFVLWYEFLRPLHKLTDRETQVVAALTRHRYELSKKVTDAELLDNLTLNDDAKKKVREELGISYTYLQIVLGKLRKIGIIVDNKLNPKFYPNIKEDANGFQLLIYYDFTAAPNIKKL